MTVKPMEFWRTTGHAPDRSLQRHRLSHGGLNAAAVPGGHHGRETMPVPYPRPGQYLLLRAGFSFQGDGPEHSENAFSSAPGECFLRAPGRKHPARVFGFPDSHPRETPAKSSARVGPSLQPKPPTLPLGSGDTRTGGQRHSGAALRTSDSERSSSCSQAHSGRFAPRIPT
jgi:hypothetical protein